MIKLEHFQHAIEYAKVRLPVLGILAFSLCSVSALHNLLASNATNAIEAFWLASVLVELVTAWLVAQVVETARQLTRSRISKQDKRFYSGLLTAFVVLAIPSLALSVWANRVEFGGDWRLGFMFPGLSVACAIGAALPGVTAKYEQGKAKVRQEAAKAKQGRVKEKAKADKERAELEQRAARMRQGQAELAQVAANLTPAARQILAQLAQDGRKSQASIAQTIDVKRQAVGYHIGRLTDLGLLKKNGTGYKVLVELGE